MATVAAKAAPFGITNFDTTAALNLMNASSNGGTTQGGAIRGRQSEYVAQHFIDEDASIQAVKGLTRILTGRAGGSTELLKILVGSFLGVRQEKLTFRTEGETRIFQIPKIIDGRIKPVRGKRPGEDVVIRNSGYWIAPEVTVAQAETSRMRAFGRNWNFAGRSAEICRIDWSHEG